MIEKKEETKTNELTVNYEGCYGSQKGHEDIVNFLLEKGANPNGKTKFGSTTLMIATQFNKIKIKIMIILSLNLKNTNFVKKNTDTIHYTWFFRRNWSSGINSDRFNFVAYVWWEKVA